MKRWKVHIVYDEDGTKRLTLRGHRVAIEFFRDAVGRPRPAMVTVTNRDGRVVESWQGDAWTIHRTRTGGKP